MKRILILCIATAIVICSSCSNKEEIRLREQHLKDSFNTLLNEKIQAAETLEAQMRDIDDNLMNISSQYAELREITSSDAAITENVAKHIEIQINAIADLLAKDKQRLATIQNQLQKQKNDNSKAEDMQNRINLLTAKVADGEDQIAKLTEDLKNKDVELKNLNTQVIQLQEQSKKNKAELLKLEDERYTGYFIVGTKKELKKAGLIDTKGGFIGIGKTTTMASNGDVSMMKKIDIRNLSEIPLTGQKVEILTSHPNNSYSLQGNTSKPSSLLITSADEFWQASRCLVILVK
ncbi:MAG: hypothetical protein IJ681_06235 [Bacteroidales bacterium]|nr:hypothetical protein [Bacteroidales bacterium]